MPIIPNEAQPLGMIEDPPRHAVDARRIHRIGDAWFDTHKSRSRHMFNSTRLRSTLPCGALKVGEAGRVAADDHREIEFH